MKSKDKVLKILKKELPTLKEMFKVKSIGIFGSYVRGKQTKTSDIDMLVEFGAPVGFFKFIELEVELQFQKKSYNQYTFEILTRRNN